MNLEDLFTELCEYGWYQKLMIWLVLLPSQWPYLCQLYAHLFMSVTPDHWCRVKLLDHLNASHHFSRHLFVPKKNNVLHNLEYEQCLVYNVSYETLVAHSSAIGWIANQTWPITGCYDGWIYNTTLLGNDNSIVTKWDLVCDRSWMQIIALVVFFAGIFMGHIILTMASNKFGMKRIYFLALVLQCLFGALTTLSSRFEIFCAFRFAVGFSVSALAIIPSALSIELSPHSRRPNVILLNEAFRNIGALFLLSVSYLIRDFAHLTVSISLPFIIFIFYWWLFPESLNWLMANERVDRIDKLIRSIASINVRYLSSDYGITLRRRIRIECAVRREMLTTQSGPTLIKVLSLPNMRRKLLLLSFHWISLVVTNVGLVYYVPEFIDQSSEKLYHLFLLVIVANLLGLLTARLTIKRCGRKCTVSGGSLLSSLFTIMSAFVASRNPTLSVAYFIAGKLFVSSSHSALLIWTYELLPESHSCAAIHFCHSLANAALIALPVIIFYCAKIEITLSKDVSLSCALLVFSLLLAVSGLLSLTLPETSDANQPRDLADAEAFGRCWSWTNCCPCGSQKKTQINGILKNKGPQQQSPILSLLRKQEIIRQNNYDSELCEKLREVNDFPNNICTIKVTVL